MHKVIVVGAGPAGLIAAYFSAMQGNRTIVFEKNEKAGKKLYITGKGRCNLTNDTSVDDFLSNVVRNSKFLFGALNSFSPYNTVSFFENNGLKLKTERGKRVFPFSDKASDVTKTLEKLCINAGVEFDFNAKVDNVITENSIVKGVISNGKSYSCDSVIIATGGLSYPLTGSTGDGYKFAKQLGHNIIAPRPSLTGIELNDDFFLEVQGLSLKNVTLQAKISGKTIFNELGELLFTHYGISGPLVLSCSALINRINAADLELFINFKPALKQEDLHRRLIREVEIAKNKSIITLLRSLLPKSIIPEVLKRCDLTENKICGTLTVAERQRIIDVIKNFSLRFKTLRPIDEAIITSGGVNVKEINPKTMESKIIQSLFFAGEVIDVDAFTGGFNIQIAFSTGYLAGLNA